MISESFNDPAIAEEGKNRLIKGVAKEIGGTVGLASGAEKRPRDYRTDE